MKLRIPVEIDGDLIHEISELTGTEDGFLAYEIKFGFENNRGVMRTATNVVTKTGFTEEYYETISNLYTRVVLESGVPAIPRQTKEMPGNPYIQGCMF